LKAILETLCNLEEARSGLIALQERGEPVLHIAACVGFSAEAEREIAVTPVGHGPWGTAFAEHKPVTVEDVDADARFADVRDLAQREGLRAVHSRPLPSLAGEVFGVLSVHFASPCRPGPRQNQLSDLCAQMASVLIERARIREETLALTSKVEIALQSSTVPFCILRPVVGEGGAVADFSWEYLNSAAARVLNRDAPQLAGAPVSQSFPGVWDQPGLLARIASALEGPVEFEHGTQAPGEQHWFQINASPCVDGVAMWFSDVTERKNQE
jgi:PAS domain-containing protein